MTIPEFPKKLLAACLLMLFALGAAGCETIKERKSAPADQLMKTGKELLKAKKYTEATLEFKQVLDDHPDSDERVMALFLMAATYYTSKEYPEAKVNYQRFIELYPAHALVDRAQYFKAMSDYKTIDLATRDQAATRNALEAFDRLILTYPKSVYRERAIRKKNECLGKLARNLFEIGKYYFDNGIYQSAIKRLQSMFDLYPDQPYYDQAIFYIAESYRREQNYKKAEEAYQWLFDHYPKSPLVKEARKLLKSFPKS